MNQIDVGRMWAGHRVKKKEFNNIVVQSEAQKPLILFKVKKA